MSLNKVMLIGRLTKDIEKRVTQGGSSVVSTSLATNERYKDKSGQNQDKTEYHNLVFWNIQADIVAEYCSKGSQIYVEGNLQTREWQDKDGNKRWTTEVVCRVLQFLDSKKAASNQTGGHSAPPEEFKEDDIPF